MTRQLALSIDATLDGVTAAYDVGFDIIPAEPDIGINGGVAIEFVCTDGEDITDTLTDREFTTLANAVAGELGL